MRNICKTVSLRKRAVKDEGLAIYIYTKPKNQQEKEYNERMCAVAEAVRCSRFESIVNERYDFFDANKMKGSFLEYFEKKAAKHNVKWVHVYKHFEKFVNGKCTFAEINVDLCNKFMEYLKTAKQTKHQHLPLHINTVSAYWSTFRHCLHEAYRDRKIRENPNGFLERIDTIPTEKEHLSQGELIRLAETECSQPVLKKAFLFACLTGLRKSDIKQLSWEDIQPYGDDGYMYVTLRMQKTKKIVHNPISDEALKLLGERGTGRIFADFKDNMTQAPLRNWLKAAGITKHITFHCTHHTFGTLQVCAGTDIYVVQKHLGHKNVATTEIYSQLADETKRQSVDKITLTKKPTPTLRVV